MRAMPHEFADTDPSVRFFYILKLQTGEFMSELMTLDEAAKYLGVSEITVKRFIREKLIQTQAHEGEELPLKEAVNRYKEIHDRMQKR
jgi:excisionase family DNA binding protein